MKQEIQSIITRNRLLDLRRCAASVFLHKDKRIATSIVSEAEPNSSSLEIYALSVIKPYQQQGYGSQILESLLDRYPDTDIYGRCSSASESMHKLLLDRGFTQVGSDGDHSIMKRDAIEIYGGMAGLMHS